MKNNFEDVEQTCFYSRKLATFPSIEAVVMQFIVSLKLFNKTKKASLNEILNSLNEKLETTPQFLEVFKRVIKDFEKFDKSFLEHVLNSFLEQNEEIELGLENDLYFVKNYGKNYERITR